MTIGWSAEPTLLAIRGETDDGDGGSAGHRGREISPPHLPAACYIEEDGAGLNYIEVASWGRHQMGSGCIPLHQFTAWYQVLNLHHGWLPLQRGGLLVYICSGLHDTLYSSYAYLSPLLMRK